VNRVFEQQASKFIRNQKIRYDSIGKAREGREETNNSSNSLTRRCRLASEDCGDIDAGQGRKETNKQRTVCEPTKQKLTSQPTSEPKATNQTNNKPTNQQTKSSGKGKRDGVCCVRHLLFWLCPKV
jgi:hypothetical protein